MTGQTLPTAMPMPMPVQDTDTLLTQVSVPATQPVRRTRKKAETSYLPPTQEEREALSREAYERWVAATNILHDLCISTAATMPADKAAHRAQIKAIEAAARGVERSSADYGRWREQASSDYFLGNIRCIELIALVSAANERYIRSLRSQGEMRRHIRFTLNLAGAQIEMIISVLTALLGGRDHTQRD